MPNYSRLLLSTGGGIISKVQKSAQRENTATILIGCGGTGKDALIQLKKSLYARVEEDPDSAKGVPKYDHIRFLVIDSDMDKVRRLLAYVWVESRV